MPTKTITKIGNVEFDPDQLIIALKSLLELLPIDPSEISYLPAQKRKKIGEQIQLTIDKLLAIVRDLDPTKQPSYVLDPSDPQIVGRLISDTLVVQDRLSLDSIDKEKFYGSGVYAIYYNGDFDAYRPLLGSETPIYVGKVDPATAQASSPTEQGPKLHGRLKEHLKSVKSAENLNAGDFECRFLVVKSAWQNTAETYLINRYMPIWNNETSICFGIGKHGDSSETRKNARSPWDTLHPGRKWAADSVPYRFSVDEIKTQIASHFINFPPVGKI